jgi:nucleoid-associated protein YgaU
MRLKEAQTLGVLALIAVCIILLCMWGGGPDLDEMYSEAQETEPAPVAQDDSPEPPRVDPRESAEGMLDREPGDDAVRESIVLRRLRDLMPDELPFEPREPKRTDPEPPPPRPRPVVHVVVRGETLSGISRQHYGTVTKWRLILEANGDALRDEYSLLPGMRLRIPQENSTDAEVATTDNAAAPILVAEETDQKVYTVQKGDTLYDIARREYGNGMDYKKILRANSDVIEHEDELKAGTKLVIP